MYVHATWWVLLLIFAGLSAYEGTWRDALWTAGYMIGVFTCILMHEFGHIEAARHFGFKTLYVVLLPIGGMARFATLPRRSGEEIAVALAGPAVNFTIVAILCLICGATPWEVLQQELHGESGILSLLIVANLALGTFNLLPIFPMDGGRVLRALFALRLPFVRATFWAATVAKILALAVGIYLMMDSFNPMVLALLLFVVWAGDAEYKSALREERAARFYAERIDPQAM